MITALLDHALTRLVIVPVLTAGYVAAASPSPAPFPGEGDRFYVSVRGPTVAGRAGFARIYADPTDGIWATMVTCGTVDVRTGRERIELQATGQAARARWGFLGGTFNPVGGGPTGGWGVTSQNELTVQVTMSAPCPTGAGDVSSGD